MWYFLIHNSFNTHEENHLFFESVFTLEIEEIYTYQEMWVFQGKLRIIIIICCMCFMWKKKLWKIAKLHYLGAVFRRCVFCFKVSAIFHATGEVDQWHLRADRKKPTRLMPGDCLNWSTSWYVIQIDSRHGLGLCIMQLYQLFSKGISGAWCG